MDRKGWSRVLRAGELEFRVRPRPDAVEPYARSYDVFTHEIGVFEVGSASHPHAAVRCFGTVELAFASEGGSSRRRAVLATSGNGFRAAHVFLGRDLVVSEICSPEIGVSVGDDGRSVAYADAMGKRIVSRVFVDGEGYVERGVELARREYRALAACAGGIRVVREDDSYGDGARPCELVVERTRTLEVRTDFRLVPAPCARALASLGEDHVFLAEAARGRERLRRVRLESE